MNEIRYRYPQKQYEDLVKDFKANRKTHAIDSLKYDKLFITLGKCMEVRSLEKEKNYKNFEMITDTNDFRKLEGLKLDIIKKTAQIYNMKEVMV